MLGEFGDDPDRYESAKARGATILAEVVGAASSTVIDSSGVANCGQALANAMRSALASARLEPKDIGHIHAHGLGSHARDIQERQALVEVLGERASSIPLVAV